MDAYLDSVGNSGSIVQRLPLLLYVPLFESIHIRLYSPERNLQGGSRAELHRYVNLLKWRIVEAKERGEGVWITII